MKLSLASILLHVIENTPRPVSTPILIALAEAKGYTKNTRSQVWCNLERLRLNGYIKPVKTGRGGKPSFWVPTVGRPAAH